MQEPSQRRPRAQGKDWGIEYYNNISIYVISNAIRTPFQGDFLVRVDPRAEALGCFLCALRAIGTHTRKSPNYRARAGTPASQCKTGVLARHLFQFSKPRDLPSLVFSRRMGKIV